MKKILLIVFGWIFLFGLSSASTKETQVYFNYQNNRYPLQTKPYMELPLGSIKPSGWLQEQLIRMSKGLTGNLDKAYEQVMGPRNGWLGGDGDVWERGPYWIDGLLPLAYILNDKALIEKVQPWIEWTLASQKPDGYFGPDTDRSPERGLQRDNSHDWWPKMVMLKVMQQYYSATQDPRIINFFTKYFKYQLEKLPQYPLGKWTFWAEQRGGDNLMLVYWLYNITGDDFLLSLGELIHKQTLNWTDIFLNQDHLYRPNSLHCVNLAQGFKEPVIYYQQNKDPKQLEAVKTAVKKMRHTIGFPTGLWGGDELLQFGDPVRGSELCTAVEMMFSLEEMIKITGDVQWMDHLERVAYNALPTQMTDHCDARQYYQQINQVAITRGHRNFSSPHEDTDIIMGVLTGYPCCTSNLHQGWPKLTQNLWYASADNGVAALVYAPSEVTVKVGEGVDVNIHEDTNYPFEETVKFKMNFPDKKVKSATFPFHFRVPGWCDHPKVMVNGSEVEGVSVARGIIKVHRTWMDKDELSIELPMKVKISYWYGGSAVVERGPLVYALKMNEQWTKKAFEKEAVPNYGDFYYEVTSDSPWNYSLMGKSLREENVDRDFVVEKKENISSYPWTLEEAPLTIKTKARKIVRWQLYNGSAGPINFISQGGDTLGEEELIELIPYGCTTLRVTEFPIR